MKSTTITLVCIILCFYVKSQDLIIIKNGDEIKAKVVEITKDEIKYKKFENLDGPVYSVSKAETFMIRYQNGTKETFVNSNNNNNNTTSKTDISNNTNNQFVPVGTMIKFKSNDKITGRKVKEGDVINFELSEQLLIGNTLVASKGNLVRGEFTDVKHKEILGKKGELAFKVSYLIANDGSKINLSSENKVSGSHNTTGRVIGAVLFTPIFLLTSGTEGKIKKDQEFVAYVDKY